MALLLPLQKAESIMYERPDSALAILENMNMPVSEDHLNHATWCLLLTQAKYKNYIKHSSDSLINIAYEYFIKRKDPQRKALSLYLMGGVNREMDEIEKATYYCLEATKEVKHTSDYLLGNLIYTELGDIYLYRKLYEYAEKAFEQAYSYAKQSGNRVYIANSVRMIGRWNAIQLNWDEAIKCYEEGIKIARTTDDIDFLSRVLSEFSGELTRKKDYIPALKYVQEALKLQTEIGGLLDQTLLTIGDLYHRMGERDSALLYLYRASFSENIYTKRSSCRILYLINKQEKRYDEAMKYGDKFYMLSDSIRRMERNNALIEMQARYDQEKVLNEKNQLKIEKDRIIHTILLILLLILFAVGILIYRYQRKLLQKERTIQHNEEQLRFYTLKIHENEALIGRNVSRIQKLSEEIEQNNELQGQLEEQQNAISEMQSQNEALRKENEKLQQNISDYSFSLQERNRELEQVQLLSDENLRLRDREKFLCKQLMKKTKILNDLRLFPKFLDVVHWQEVIDTVDWLYENYTKRLNKDFPSLTESDLQVCCLIKLHLSVSEIAMLLGISSTSVSKRKLRLKERIIHELGRPFEENQTLDIWLWEY